MEQRKFRIEQNISKFGLTSQFIKSLKIPKLLSHSIGYHLTIKQIKEEKNNFSIVEKINQLNNLIKCMKNKISTIEKVERRRKQEKLIDVEMNGEGAISYNITETKSYNILLRRLDKNNKKFELVQ